MANIAILSIYSGVVERGVENFAFEIGSRLSKKHKVTLFQGGTKGSANYNIVKVKTPIKPPVSSKGLFGKFNIDFQSLKILFFTLKITPKLILNKYDLIIPLNGGWQTVLCRIITKLTGAKLLISGHAGIGSDDAWNLFFRPDVFVALTTSQANWANKLTPEARIEIIPNGVDLSKFNPKVKAVQLPLDEPIIVCTSALVPYKRVDLTIRAVAKGKNLSLLVLGDGEMRGQIDSLGKRLLGKRYLRLSIPYEKIPSYYKAAKVFTLVSRTEAFGISYIEAMACNLPVVATCDSSRQEIIGRAGILTNAENIEKYTKDLLIATKTNYKNIPYDQALKFSWNKIAEKYDKLIINLISK